MKIFKPFRNMSLQRRLMGLFLLFIATALAILFIWPIWNSVQQVEQRQERFSVFNGRIVDVVVNELQAHFQDGVIDYRSIQKSKFLRDIMNNNPDMWIFLSNGRETYQYGQNPVWYRETSVLLSKSMILNDLQGSRVNMNGSVFHKDHNLDGFVSYHVNDGRLYYIEIGGISEGAAPNRPQYFNVDYDGMFWNMVEARYPEVFENFLVLGGGLTLITFLIFFVFSRSLKKAVAVIKDIEPGRMKDPIPEENVPLEILPLVQAFNQTLSRIDEAYRQQRFFTAAAAHEMRTPLAIMRGRVAELPDSAGKARLEDDVRNMSSLVTQLLQLPGLRAAPPKFEPLDLVQVTRDICADHGAIIINEGKHLALDSETDSVMIEADPAMLRSAIGNIIENAGMFTKEGGHINVYVSAKGDVSVQDDGPGVDEADMEHIFDPFFKKPRNKKGNGLGLAIVKEIMKIHQGTVRVENSDDHGAIFTLSFP